MRLVYTGYNLEIKLIENQINVITIENTEMFSKIVSDLWSQMEGGEGGFILSDNDKILNIAKNLEFIVNPVAVNCNDKKILSKLYKELENMAMEELYENLSKLNSDIVATLDLIIKRATYGLESELQLDVTGLFKLYDVKFPKGELNLAERLIEYLSICHQICGIKVFVFLNLKQFMSDEEIDGIYEFACYEKIHLILFEGSFHKKSFLEKNLIIDRDRCIIEVN